MLLFMGTRDILNPDAHLFVEKAHAAGVAAELIETKGMFHVWPLLDIPEGRKASEQIMLICNSRGWCVRFGLFLKVANGLQVGETVVYPAKG